MVTSNSPSADTGAATLPQRILITGINYWPEVTGIAPYTTALAEHLVARGTEVTVITGMPYYPQWRILEGYRGRLRVREAVRGVAVRHFRHYVPGRQSAARRALFEATFLLHSLSARSVPRPDAIVGVVPNLGGGLLAAAASRRYHAPFGLIVQDLTGQAARQSAIPGGARVAGVTRAAEGWLVRRAAAVAIVAEGFRPYLHDVGVDAARIHRIRNWTHIGAPTRTPAETRARAGLPNEAVVCLHAGNMGYKQGLENVIDCARLATREPASRLLFVLMGDGNQRADLEERTAGLPNVRFLPPQPEEEFPNMLAAADLLLVNQRPSVIDMSLPGKLTSYFAAGRPVVAAVAAQSETATELRAARAGVVVEAGAPELLLVAIRSLAADRGRAAELGRLGQAYAAAHLTAEGALARIEQFITDIARPPAGATRRETATAVRSRAG